MLLLVWKNSKNLESVNDANTGKQVFWEKATQLLHLEPRMEPYNTALWTHSAYGS